VVAAPWAEVSGLPTTTYCQAVAELNGALYSFGGKSSGSTTISNVYRFNGSVWTQVAAMPAARGFLAGAALDGAIYAIGGNDGTARTNVYRYSGSTWTEVAGLPAIRWQLAVAVLNGALYAIGGMNDDMMNPTKTNVYRFNGSTWTEVAGLPAARSGLAAGVLNGALYALGGDLGGSKTNVYRFDGTNWTEVAGLPTACYGLAAGTLNGALYAVAGTGGGMTNVYRFDGSAWTEMSGLPTGRYNLAVGVLSNALYAVGGYNVSAKTNVYRFDEMLGLRILGTNGAGIVSGDAATADKGTDFGSAFWSVPRTNVFSMINTGIGPLTVSAVLTNGAGAAAFRVTTGGQIAAGATSALAVVFAPTAAQAFTAQVSIVNNGGQNPFVLNLCGTGLISDQVITFPTIADQTVNSTVGLNATASSGLPVSFAVTNGPGQITGGTNLSFTATGTVSVTASQAGDANWNAAASVTRSCNVTKGNQTIAFPPIADQPFNGTVGLSATASSGLPVSFAVAAGPGQITGGTNLSFTATGTVSVTASQAGDANWNAAADVTRTVVVIKASQTITFPAIADQMVTGTVTLSATASSGLPVSFAVAAGPGQISGSALAFTGTGRVSVSASQTGNANYEPAASVVNTFNVLEVVAVLAADFDGDGRADPALYYTSAGSWLVRLSAGGYAAATLTDFGGLGYAASAGDMDGDRLADPIVYNSSTKRFTTMLSGSGYPRVSVTGFGDAGYQPIRGDFDGDRKADPAVFQAASGTFAVRLSASGYAAASVSGFGDAGHLPVDGDYDGDRLADLAIYAYGVAAIPEFGGPAYATVSGDFDGDGKADPAIYHAGTGDWDIELSTQSYMLYTLIGLGDSHSVAVAGDFDGDGKADPAIYDPTTGLLTVKCSTLGYAATSLPLWP
jgi:hypothetical protein